MDVLTELKEWLEKNGVEVEQEGYTLRPKNCVDIEYRKIYEIDEIVEKYGFETPPLLDESDLSDVLRCYDKGPLTLCMTYSDYIDCFSIHEIWLDVPQDLISAWLHNHFVEFDTETDEKCKRWLIKSGGIMRQKYLNDLRDALELEGFKEKRAGEYENEEEYIKVYYQQQNQEYLKVLKVERCKK